MGSAMERDGKGLESQRRDSQLQSEKEKRRTQTQRLEAGKVSLGLRQKEQVVREKSAWGGWRRKVLEGNKTLSAHVTIQKIFGCVCVEGAVFKVGKGSPREI